MNAIAPRHIRAQAAVWVADLHGPHRDVQLEARLRRWIAADPRHAAAFELATDAWQRSGNLRADLPTANSPPRYSRARAVPARARASREFPAGPALAGSAVLCTLLIALFYFLRDDAITTGAAEQRTVILSDGTQVSLNARSHLLVKYDDRTRQVTLAQGEAYFNVAKHQPRPFVVLLGARKVIALGTAFEVRREDTTGSTFAVTLVEGSVAIEPRAWPDALPSDPAPGLTLLTPGQRLQVAADVPDRIDLPSLDRVTAWQKGQLIFDDASLREAAHEFNRYGTRKIIIGTAVPATLRVGGVFRIGDPESFAQAMANAYPLRIVQRGENIILDRQ